MPVRKIDGLVVRGSLPRKRRGDSSPVFRLDVLAGDRYEDFLGYISFGVVDAYRKVGKEKIYGTALVVVDAFSRERGWMVDFLKKLRERLSRAAALQPIVGAALIHPQHLPVEEEDVARQELLSYFRRGIRIGYYVEGSPLHPRWEPVVVEDIQRVLKRKEERSLYVEAYLYIF